MLARNAIRTLAAVVAIAGVAFAFQRPFHQYPGVEYFQFELPPDYQQPAEFAFARLMFPPGPLDGYYPRFQGDWRKGLSLWTQDYPRADRHFSQALRRLTRVTVRSVEQPIELEDDSEVFNWPWLYAVQVGEWGLNEDEGRILREYLLRGGFFMADDFHGAAEWGEFQKRIQFAFPDRPIVDIPDNDPIFHTVYDLSDRFQVPGQAHLRLGYKANGPDSIGAHWRGIYDDKGRIMVAISYNSDLGDAWEYADDPYYPEKFSGLAIRVGVNYVIYALTH
ncbi:MAG TPA: DUF4159 domain-containing protein [Bryobacteraceae bacterium]|jgi:hypothetical protein|nr:DUF4159 domain-containing protein [Bryobacteraceae bacterium]